MMRVMVCAALLLLALAKAAAARQRYERRGIPATFGRFQSVGPFLEFESLGPSAYGLRPHP
jgi:hypothetical protein